MEAMKRMEAMKKNGGEVKNRGEVKNGGEEKNGGKEKKGREKSKRSQLYNCSVTYLDFNTVRAPRTTALCAPLCVSGSAY